VVKRIVFSGLVALLVLPAVRGRDEPKDDKKPPSVKEQYDALVKEFSAAQRKVIADLRAAKGEEREKLIEKYMGLGKEYAGKFYQLAEDNPKDPTATDALFWVMQHGAGSSDDKKTESPAYKKAEGKVTALVLDLPLKELTRRLNGVSRTKSNVLLEAVAKRAEKDDSEDLLAWVATSGIFSPTGEKAAVRLAEKYPDHPAVNQVVLMLGRGGQPGAVETLKQIIEKTTKPRVKADAGFAVGQALAARADELGDKPAEAEKVAAEAEKYLTAAVDQFGKEDLTDKKEAAERELKAFRTLRVGKEAPEISGKDLDGKEFKLSDYRGKVVLLDFWGNW